MHTFRRLSQHLHICSCHDSSLIKLLLSNVADSYSTGTTTYQVLIRTVCCKTIAWRRLVVDTVANFCVVFICKNHEFRMQCWYLSRKMIPIHTRTAHIQFSMRCTFRTKKIQFHCLPLWHNSVWFWFNETIPSGKAFERDSVSAIAHKFYCCTQIKCPLSRYTIHTNMQTSIGSLGEKANKF